jgi:hypothetical protein
MRDKLKDKNYFEEYLNEKNQSINKLLNWIETGKIPVQRIPIVKCSIADNTN